MMDNRNQGSKTCSTSHISSDTSECNRGEQEVSMDINPDTLAKSVPSVVEVELPMEIDENQIDSFIDSNQLPGVKRNESQILESSKMCDIESTLGKQDMSISTLSESAALELGEVSNFALNESNTSITSHAEPLNLNNSNTKTLARDIDASKVSIDSVNLIQPTSSSDDLALQPPVRISRVSSLCDSSFGIDNLYETISNNPANISNSSVFDSLGRNDLNKSVANESNTLTLVDQSPKKMTEFSCEIESSGPIKEHSEQIASNSFEHGDLAKESITDASVKNTSVNSTFCINELHKSVSENTEERNINCSLNSSLGISCLYKLNESNFNRNLTNTDGPVDLNQILCLDNNSVVSPVRVVLLKSDPFPGSCSVDSTDVFCKPVNEIEDNSNPTKILAAGSENQNKEDVPVEKKKTLDGPDCNEVDTMFDFTRYDINDVDMTCVFPPPQPIQVVQDRSLRDVDETCMNVTVDHSSGKKSEACMDISVDENRQQTISIESSVRIVQEVDETCINMPVLIVDKNNLGDSFPSVMSFSEYSPQDFTLASVDLDCMNESVVVTACLENKTPSTELVSLVDDIQLDMTAGGSGDPNVNSDMKPETSRSSVASPNVTLIPHLEKFINISNSDFEYVAGEDHFINPTLGETNLVANVSSKEENHSILQHISINERSGESASNQYGVKRDATPAKPQRSGNSLLKQNLDTLARESPSRSPLLKRPRLSRKSVQRTPAVASPLVSENTPSREVQSNIEGALPSTDKSYEDENTSRSGDDTCSASLQVSSPDLRVSTMANLSEANLLIDNALSENPSSDETCKEDDMTTCVKLAAEMSLTDINDYEGDNIILKLEDSLNEATCRSDNIPFNMSSDLTSVDEINKSQASFSENVATHDTKNDENLSLTVNVSSVQSLGDISLQETDISTPKFSENPYHQEMSRSLMAYDSPCRSPKLKKTRFSKSVVLKLHEISMQDETLNSLANDESVISLQDESPECLPDDESVISLIDTCTISCGEPLEETFQDLAIDKTVDVELLQPDISMHLLEGSVKVDRTIDENATTGGPADSTCRQQDDTGSPRPLDVSYEHVEYESSLSKVNECSNSQIMEKSYFDSDVPPPDEISTADEVVDEILTIDVSHSSPDSSKTFSTDVDGTGCPKLTTIDDSLGQSFELRLSENSAYEGTIEDIETTCDVLLDKTIDVKLLEPGLSMKLDATIGVNAVANELTECESNMESPQQLETEASLSTTAYNNDVNETSINATNASDVSYFEDGKSSNIQMMQSHFQDMDMSFTEVINYELLTKNISQPRVEPPEKFATDVDETAFPGEAPELGLLGKSHEGTQAIIVLESLAKETKHHESSLDLETSMNISTYLKKVENHQQALDESQLELPNIEETACSATATNVSMMSNSIPETPSNPDLETSMNINTGMTEAENLQQTLDKSQFEVSNIEEVACLVTANSVSMVSNFIPKTTSNPHLLAKCLLEKSLYTLTYTSPFQSPLPKKSRVSGNSEHEEILRNCSNISDYMWDSFMPDATLDREQSLAPNDGMTDLSESVNKSVCPEKMLPHEVGILKENLCLIMEILEKENNEFDAFKKNCEYEKAELLLKINYLEEKLKIFNDLKSSNKEKGIIEEQLKKKELELSELLAKNSSEGNLEEKDFEKYKNLLLLSEAELPNLSSLVENLNSLGISSDGIILDGNIINLKSVLNILNSLLVKHNETMSNYNNLVETNQENKIKLSSLNELTDNHNAKVDELCLIQEKCDELQNSLKLNENLVSKLQEEVVSYKEINKSLEDYKNEADFFRKKFENLQVELADTKKTNSEFLSKYNDLEKELDSAVQSCESIKHENNELMMKYKVCQDELLKLKDAESKYSDLVKHCDELSEKCSKFEDNISVKVRECEQLFKENEILQTELLHFNSLLEDNKKNIEEDRQHLMEDYKILKNRFEEQSELLDKSMLQIDSFKETNTIILNSLQNSNCFTGNNEIPTGNDAINSEFILLVNKFDEITSKCKALYLAQNNLHKSYVDAKQRIHFLESEYGIEVELNKKHLEEISTLNARFNEISDKNHDLQAKYDLICSKTDAGSSQLICLKDDLEKLKIQYDESLKSIAKLEQTCEEKTECCKILEDAISSLNETLHCMENNYSKLKLEYDDVSSKYERECASMNHLQNEYSLLTHNYEELLGSFEEVKQFSLEKDNINEQNQSEINSLLKEKEEIKYALSIVNTNYEQLTEKYESETLKTTSLQADITDLLKKYEESILNGVAIKEECLQKENIINKRELELSNLSVESDELRNNLLKLKSDYDSTLLNLEGVSSKYSSLLKDYSDLKLQLDGTLERYEKLEIAYSEISENNGKNIMEINNLNAKNSELQENLNDLTNDQNGYLLKLEVDLSKLNLLQSEISELKVKYQETLASEKNLEDLCAKKDSEIEKLSEDLRLLNNEFVNVKSSLDALTSDYTELRSASSATLMKLELESSKFVSLQDDCSSIKSQLEEALAQKQKLEIDYSEVVESNEKNISEINILSTKISELHENINNLKKENNDILLKLEMESSKYNSLQSEFSDLDLKYQEIVSIKENLERDCAEKNSDKEKLSEDLWLLTDELSTIKSNIDGLNSEYSALKAENNDISLKLETELSKYNSLQCEFSDLDLKYKEVFSHKKNLEDMCAEKDSLNEKLSENLRLLSDELSTIKSNLDTHNSEYTALMNENNDIILKLEAESSKYNSLQSEFSDLGLKYQEIISIKKHLENVSAEKDSVIQKLSEDLQLLNDELSTMKSNLGALDSEYTVLKNENSDLVLKLGTESSKYSSLQSEFSGLDLKYQEVVSIKKTLEDVCAEKDSVNEKLSEDLQLLTDELSNIKSNLDALNSEYATLKNENNDMGLKLETETCKYNSLQSEFSALDLKHHELFSNKKNLEDMCAEKDSLNEKLSENLQLLSDELSTIKCNLDALNSEYATLKDENSDMVLKLETESSKYNSLQSEFSDLDLKYQEVVSIKKTLEDVCAKKDSVNEKLSEDLRLLTDELSNIKSNLDALNSEYAALKSENNNVVLKLETEISKYNSLQSEFSDLDLKYHEMVSHKKNLEDMCAEKDSVIEELSDDVKLLNTELTDIKTSLERLSSDYTALNEEKRDITVKLKTESSKYNSLQTEFSDLELKYKETVTSKKNIEGMCMEKDTLNEKLSEDLRLLNAELVNIKANLDTLTVEHAELKNVNSDNLLKLEVESSKFNALQLELTDLNLKCQEAVAANENLKVDCLEKSAANHKLLEDVGLLKSEVEEISKRLSCSKIEYADLLAKHNLGNSEHIELKTTFKDLLSKYGECLSWVRNLEKGTSAVTEMYIENKEDQESPMPDFETEIALETLSIKHQNHFDLFNKALRNFQLIVEFCSNNKEAKEKLERDIKLLKEGLAESEHRFTDLKTNYDSLNDQLRDGNSQCESLKHQIQDLELNYSDTLSKLADLQKDYSEKIADNELLKKQREIMTNDIAQLKTSLDSLSEELKISTEKYETVVQECNALKEELQSVCDEKTLREELEIINVNLKNKIDHLETEVSSKETLLQSLVLDYKSLEEKSNSEKATLRLENDELVKRMSELSGNIAGLHSEIEKLKLTNSELESNIEKKHFELRTASQKIDSFKLYEDQIGIFKADFPDFNELFESIENDFSLSENFVFDTFFQCVGNVLKIFSKAKDELVENKSSFARSQAEVEKLNNDIKELADKLQRTESKLNEMNESYIVLKESNSSLTHSHNEIEEKCKSIYDQYHALANENNSIKILNENLNKQIDEFSKTVLELQVIRNNYDSLLVENKENLSQLSATSLQNENMKQQILRNEKEFLDLKTELEKYSHEVAVLRNENTNLKDECNKFSSMYTSIKGSTEVLEIEIKKLKAEKVKYEKEYQSSIDSLCKTKEEMCEIEKNCEEKMAQFTYILKEKVDFENKTFSLLKQNDELTNKIKDLIAKVNHFEKSHGMLSELQAAHATLLKEKSILEKQLSDVEKHKKENTDLKASLAVKASKMNELMSNMKQMKDSYQQKSNENKVLVEKICSLLPDAGDFQATVEALENKLKHLNSIEEELEEEKLKCENLDEECNTLNVDLQYKDKVIGDMYKEHVEEVDSLKQTLKDFENASEKAKLDNSSLKEKILDLEKEISKLKTSGPAPCKKCSEPKESTQKLKADIAARDAKITSLIEHLEGFQSSYKKKVQEYKKTISSLQSDLKKACKSEKSVKAPSSEAGSQTEQLQLTGQSGIVQSAKIMEQEEKIHKMEKENLILKKVCHNRLQTIKDMQTKLDAQTPSEQKKTQRTVLSEVQNKE